MAGNVYFNRIGHVAIMGEKGELVHYGPGDDALDFKFSITKSVNTPIGEAHIEVYGLNLPTIQRLTYWGNYEEKELEKRHVVVYAGYDDEGRGKDRSMKIFDGYGYRVTPTQPPNAGVIIEAKNNLYYGRSDYSVSFAEAVLFKDCCKFVAERLNLVVQDSDFDTISEKTIGNFHTSGTVYDLITSLCGLHNVYVWIEGGKLRVANRVQTAPKSEKDSFPIKLENGLLGLNSMTMQGIEARTRLDNRLDRAWWVHIESSLYPKRATGNYWVHHIEHRGHLRGQEWDTIVRAYNSHKLF